MWRLHTLTHTPLVAAAAVAMKMRSQYKASSDVCSCVCVCVCVVVLLFFHAVFSNLARSLARAFAELRQ